MVRRLSTFASAISLLLCLTTAAMWVRSHWIIGSVVYTTPHREGNDVVDRSWVIFGSPGRIGLARTEYTHGDVTAEELKELVHPGEWSHYSVPASDYWDKADAVFFYDASDWRFHGFGFYLYVSGGEYNKILELPYWAIFLLFAVLPLFALRRILRVRGRKVRGLCVACGYDLRASPKRCPECGVVIRNGKLPLAKSVGLN